MPPARIGLWVASIAAVAILVRSVWLEPVPVWFAVAAMVGYLGLMVAGIAWPRLEMFGDVVWRGEAGQRLVALTFDDGPHPVGTRTILEILARGGHRATFFLVGSKVDHHPDVVREIVAAGHTLGVHGHTHSWTYSLRPPREVRRDILRAQEAVVAACGVRPALFRPPIGLVSPRTAKGAEQAGCPIVLWSVKGGDGVPVRPETVLRRVAAGLRDGAIVLLHDAAETGDRLSASVAALPDILERIDRLGLTTVGVEAFVESAGQGSGAAPGTPA